MVEHLTDGIIIYLVLKNSKEILRTNIRHQTCIKFFEWYDRAKNPESVIFSQFFISNSASFMHPDVTEEKPALVTFDRFRISNSESSFR